METREKISFITNILDEKKAEDVIVAQAPENILVDSFIVCTATSSTHMKTLYDTVKKDLRENDVEIVSTTGYDSRDSGWMIIDTGDIVLHIFEREKREFYNLERLWNEYLSEQKNG